MSKFPGTKDSDDPTGRRQDSLAHQKFPPFEDHSNLSQSYHNHSLMVSSLEKGLPLRPCPIYTFGLDPWWIRNTIPALLMTIEKRPLLLTEKRPLLWVRLHMEDVFQLQHQTYYALPNGQFITSQPLGSLTRTLLGTLGFLLGTLVFPY